MVKRFPWLHVPSALVVLLCGLELGLRLLPVSTAMHLAYYNGSPLPSYPPGHRWVRSSGWDLRNAQTLTANAQGFVADHDFVPNPKAVALIGDSYVEAGMLPPRDRLAAQLERRLGSEHPVYAMGIPGNALLDHGLRLRWALDRFHMRQAVLFLEYADLRQSLCGSGQNLSLCMDRESGALRPQHLPPCGVFKRLLRRSALAQYLFTQLKVDGRRLRASLRHQLQPPAAGPPGIPVARAPGPLTVAEREEIEAVAGHFFAQLEGLPLRPVLLLDADRYALMRGESGTDPTREYFMSLARAAGLTVVDLAPVFSRHLRAGGEPLEIGPLDTHLNAMGLGLVTEATAAVLDPH